MATGSKKILSKQKKLEVLGNGEQCKPYSHVDELINCMIFLKNKRKNELIKFYNIGSSDKGVKVKKIVQLLIKKFNCNKKIFYQKQKFGWPGDIISYRYSNLLLDGFQTMTITTRISAGYGGTEKSKTSNERRTHSPH